MLFFSDCPHSEGDWLSGKVAVLQLEQLLHADVSLGKELILKLPSDWCACEGEPVCIVKRLSDQCDRIGAV